MIFRKKETYQELTQRLERILETNKEELLEIQTKVADLIDKIEGEPAKMEMVALITATIIHGFDTKKRKTCLKLTDTILRTQK